MSGSDVHKIIEAALGELLSCNTALPSLFKTSEQSILADDVCLLSKMLADQLLLAGYELVLCDRTGTKVAADSGSLALRASTAPLS